MIRTSVPKTKTSKKPFRFKADQGFSLIEIMIVISLIGIILTIGVPKISSALRISLSSSNRDIASFLRAVHDEAALRGTTHRIVFDLKKNEYWAEYTTDSFLLKTEEQEQLEKKLEDRRSDDEKKAKKVSFEYSKTLSKKKKTLPRGVKFTAIKTPAHKDPVTNGNAYIYFFPNGFSENAIIRLKDDTDRDATLVLSPTTGKPYVFDHYFKESNI